MTFVGYRVSGQGQQITLLDGSLTLSAFHEQWLAIVVLLSVVILPALFCPLASSSFGIIELTIKWDVGWCEQLSTFAFG